MFGNQANCRSSGSLVPAMAPPRVLDVTDIVHAVAFCAANWPESYSWVNTLVKAHHDPGRVAAQYFLPSPGRSRVCGSAGAGAQATLDYL
jgi:hypothetical protein